MVVGIGEKNHSRIGPLEKRYDILFPSLPVKVDITIAVDA
jgi:hypothetical protein